MSNKLAIALVLGFLLAFGSSAGRAQATNTNSPGAVIPVLPMSVRFRTVSFYVRGSLAEGSRYSSIEALVDNQQSEPWIEIVLTDRASTIRVHYCNVQRSVGSMTDRGEEAYFAPIEFHSEQESTKIHVMTFHFVDSAGESIEWPVTLDAAASGPGSEPDIISPPDRAGFGLIYGAQGTAELKGSAFLIKGSSHVAARNEEPNDPAITGILYATDVIVAEIYPGTEIWNIASQPVKRQDGAQWVLQSSGGRKRFLTIEHISEDGMLVKQEEPENPDSARAQLDVRAANGNFIFHSVTFMNQGHTLLISFEPGLPLPAPQTTDVNDATFSIDEDGHRSVAAGSVSAARAIQAEHVTWQLDAPDWAKAHTFETGVNILFVPSAK
jgi:hypothetical protein